MFFSKPRKNLLIVRVGAHFKGIDLQIGKKINAIEPFLPKIWPLLLFQNCNFTTFHMSKNSVFLTKT